MRSRTTASTAPFLPSPYRPRRARHDDTAPAMKDLAISPVKGQKRRVARIVGHRDLAKAGTPKEDNSETAERCCERRQGLQRQLTLTSDDEGTMMGRKLSECGQMGVRRMQATDGCTMLPPAATWEEARRVVVVSVRVCKDRRRGGLLLRQSLALLHRRVPSHIPSFPNACFL